MKRIAAFMLAVALVLCLAAGASAKVVTKYDVWELEKYRNDTEWMINFCSSQEETVDVIGSYIGFDVTYINEYAFADNHTMKALNIAYEVLAIGKYAFINDSTLESAVLTSNISVLGEGAFSNTTALHSINLEDTRLSVIEPYVFFNSGIESITLPDSCNTIESHAFSNCANLSDVYLTNSIGEIADDAFDGSPNVVICAKEDSYAIQYATAHNIDYRIIDRYYLIGDADCDNRISIFDATKIQSVLANLDDDPDGMIALRGDINGDGLTILDATAIQRFLAFLSTNPAIKTIAYY